MRAVKVLALSAGLTAGLLAGCAGLAACTGGSAAVPTSSASSASSDGTPGTVATKGDPMTPEQALAKLESDFAAAIKTVAPAAGGEFFDDPHRNTPCGGPAGTELTEVTSDLVGVLAPADWDHDRDAAIQALRGFAGAHGYQVVVDEKAGDQVNVTLVTPGENRDAFSLGFLFFTNQRVNLLGGTPCLPNPDR